MCQESCPMWPGLQMNWVYRQVLVYILSGEIFIFYFFSNFSLSREETCQNTFRQMRPSLSAIQVSRRCFPGHVFISKKHIILYLYLMLRSRNYFISGFDCFLLELIVKTVLPPGSVTRCGSAILLYRVASRIIS